MRRYKRALTSTIWRTDGQTPHDGIGRAYAQHRAAVVLNDSSLTVLKLPQYTKFVFSDAIGGTTGDDGSRSNEATSWQRCYWILKCFPTQLQNWLKP